MLNEHCERAKSTSTPLYAGAISCAAVIECRRPNIEKFIVRSRVMRHGVRDAMSHIGTQGGRAEMRCGFRGIFRYHCQISGKLLDAISVHVVELPRRYRPCGGRDWRRWRWRGLLRGRIGL